MDDDNKVTNPDDEGSTGDDEVGYKNPPKHTQFKPGQSGNPRGRPKGTNNLKTDLADVLSEKIDIREGNHPRKVSKQMAFVISMVNRGIKGDARATNSLLSTIMRLRDPDEESTDVEEPLLDNELEILDTFKERVRRDSDDQAESTRTRKNKGKGKS